MTDTLDLSATVARRLADESVIWLTTVDAKSTPVPTPVWFLWRDGSFLLFSQPGARKLANIAADRRVALNLNSDAHGGDVAVFTGHAVVDADVPDDDWNRYVEKYEQQMASLDYTPARFRDDYSVPVRVIPVRVRQW
ncbi:TIGR03667 family PPOX class F420-dependent oxidoreductase [Rhodococcus coprophilus]|uniref:Transposase n=1 Tax=Rhodococcus coprophilus TaxID=38310 RepID=A0A2X4UJD2_9NOCA|nr:TIGR03667 family PPOX class F420-dependent oxidoreductase [Rhodococcus coprophilus]MBM7460198.1 PPOX class probable F420-dependent enzyme [Rhodococcus coprophilus]SQI38761.1 transposase [Rhodococcus coprophilus]